MIQEVGSVVGVRQKATCFADTIIVCFLKALQSILFQNTFLKANAGSWSYTANDSNEMVGLVPWR